MRELASRGLLALAAVAIGFAAADTYVVVLALPDMMTAAGLTVADLQRAAPIISGFLLGYVAVLPLIGRVSDLRGRVPVLIGCLVVFAIGSVITAAGYDLTSIVLGRFIQGIGGGGLIPPTLALIADTWPAERRGLPLGIVGAVQELGSVVGPLWGAAILAFGTWHDIFWVNAAVGLVIAAALLRHRPPRPDRGWDVPGLVLALLTGGCLLLVMLEPESLTTGVTSGLAFLPVVGESRWLTPLALVAYGLGAAFVVRQATAARPLIAWREWGQVARQTDLWGAAALTVALGAVILTFASAEPERAVLADDAIVLLPVAAIALALFVWRGRHAAHPLIPRGSLSAAPAWGSIAVSFFVGSALIAALVDIPFFARLTIAPDDQLEAALVLLRFLVALPVGAVAGGWLLRRVPAGPLTAAALTLSGACFLVMASWDAKSLETFGATVVLAACGLGFGLAIAPVNAALLEHTAAEVHGLASALLVVARMVGMLIGISALTSLGLRAFRAAVADIPPIEELCSGATTACRAYNGAMRDAGIAQLQAVFTGAAVAAFIAAALALLLLRRRATFSS
ncbi:MFS transporter [Aeromicrobium choanae]|uniref:Predicted arabinose efflux permease, MFS family n=1 Tax=Aeromicrobium choanae TaxID=1736691 RepID=A0A1T4YMA0_9ACTN|nr:MFS transporter [Aeromicrobium choanae]SKB02964.1 Predicted arabinose efflux permease, MFS family [Aeromicrobium choanae]